MKKFSLAIVAALLVAVLFFTPAAAASSSVEEASETCGDYYTVQHLDNLAKISRSCGTTVADILALNPQITNPSLIYSGQILRLSGSVPSTPTSSTTYTVQSGDTLNGIAGMFGVSGWALRQANAPLWDGGSVYSGQVLNIPRTGNAGNPRVSLSTTQAEAGDTVTVTVSGFAANASVDYRVGEQGEEYSVVYDGTVDSDGNDSATITLPSDADEGEYWVVLVITTDQVDEVGVYSHTIYITD